MLTHAIPPTRFFSQTPNEIIRHPRLTGVAVRLLQWALSLPEGSRETVQSIGARMPEGRIAVRKARQQLEQEGYLHTRRLQCPDTGRWTTRVLVSNVPLTSEAEIEAAFGAAPVALMSASAAPVPARTRSSVPIPSTDLDAVRTPAPRGGMLTVGAPPVRAVGTSPKGENTAENTPHPDSPAPPAEDLLLAGELLSRLGDRDARLRLGAAEAARLAPLAAHWLAHGVTGPRLCEALLADLPPVVRAPAALLTFRLRAAIPPSRGPASPVQPLAECGMCRDPLPRGQRTGICGRCAGVAPPPPAPRPGAVAGAALVRAALRGHLPGVAMVDPSS